MHGRRGIGLVVILLRWVLPGLRVALVVTLPVHRRLRVVLRRQVLRLLTLHVVLWWGGGLVVALPQPLTSVAIVGGGNGVVAPIIWTGIIATIRMMTIHRTESRCCQGTSGNTYQSRGEAQTRAKDLAAAVLSSVRAWRASKSSQKKAKCSNVKSRRR